MFGVAMAVTLVLRRLAARRHNSSSLSGVDDRNHAIGLVTGTQVFTLGCGAIFGKGHLTPALLLAAARAINLALAK
jgi:hypothetical protein